MYRRLMIVVDEDPASRAAVVEGLDLASALGAEVLFFHVVPNYATPVTVGDLMPLGAIDPVEHERHVQQRAGRVLAEAAAMAKAKAVLSTALLGHGDETAASIAHAAKEQHCDLIVVGSHGRNALQRLIFGSVPASLLPLAPVPMVVCKVRDRN